MHGKTLARAVLLLGLGAAAAGCSSRAEEICALICECEHCNDYDADVSCTLLETQEEVAGIYDCAAAFETWTTCVEERGTCTADVSSFATSHAGSCSVSVSTGAICVSDNDCGTLGFGVRCEAGTCVQLTCVGHAEQQCNEDFQCPEYDLCDAEQKALDACIDKASAHDGPPGPI